MFMPLLRQKGVSGMRDTIGILYANNDSDQLQGLAQYRPIAAVPFGGRYRLLDFALSNMVNSGLRTIGMIMPFLYRPLSDHLGAGKSWFLDRKGGGLYILPGAINGLRNKNKFYIKDLKLNYEFLYKDFAENVIISSCNQVFNLHYGEVLSFHERMSADVTLIYREDGYDGAQAGQECLNIGEDQLIRQIDKSLGQEQTHDGNNSVNGNSLGILIIRRHLLMEIIKGYHAVDTADLMEVIAENLSSLRVYGYPFAGYMKSINSVEDYFKGNMDLLDLQIREKLLLGGNRIHTKIIDNPPTRYGSHAQIRKSLVSSGCEIDGEVENSVLSRGVVVERGAQIKNSIVLQKCVIRADAKLDYVILDKSLEVDMGNIINGRHNHPLVMQKKPLI